VHKTFYFNKLVSLPKTVLVFHFAGGMETISSVVTATERTCFHRCVLNLVTVFWQKDSGLNCQV